VYSTERGQKQRPNLAYRKLQGSKEWQYQFTCHLTLSTIRHNVTMRDKHRALAYSFYKYTRKYRTSSQANAYTSRRRIYILNVTIRVHPLTCSYASAPLRLLSLLVPSLRVQFQRLAAALISSSPSPRPSLENQREVIFVERTEELFWTADQPPPPDSASLIDSA